MNNKTQRLILTSREVNGRLVLEGVLRIFWGSFWNDFEQFYIHFDFCPKIFVKVSTVQVRPQINGF